jgi:nicotinic acid mononucleotide adenylyltransferase
MGMRSIVYAFGRINPPTKGHSLLVSKVIETAKAIGGDHIVYLSQTQNKKTDPLDWNFKRRVCESAFRGVNISQDTSIRNPYIALESLAKEYDNIVMVAGSDQADEFTKRFTPYADKWGINFSVVSAGQRIVESEGVEGMSASKLRQYAAEGNKEKFLLGLPDSLSESIKKLVYTNVRKGLK